MIRNAARYLLMAEDVLRPKRRRGEARDGAGIPSRRADPNTTIASNNRVIKLLQKCNVPRQRERPMDQHNAEWYRARAAECSALAEKATDRRIKAFNQAEADR